MFPSEVSNWTDWGQIEVSEEYLSVHGNVYQEMLNQKVNERQSMQQPSPAHIGSPVIEVNGEAQDRFDDSPSNRFVSLRLFLQRYWLWKPPRKSRQFRSSSIYSGDGLLPTNHLHMVQSSSTYFNGDPERLSADYGQQRQRWAVERVDSLWSQFRQNRSGCKRGRAATRVVWRGVRAWKWDKGDKDSRMSRAMDFWVHMPHVFGSKCSTSAMGKLVCAQAEVLSIMHGIEVAFAELWYRHVAEHTMILDRSTKSTSSSRQPFDTSTS